MKNVMSGGGKLAIVTGSNKGLGLAIVEGLCKTLGQNQKGWKIMLTARNESLGKEAVECLKLKGFSPLWHQLDISNKESIEKFVEDVQNEFGGLDLLVNNAGIAFKGSAPEPIAVQAEETMKVNYFGTLSLTEALMPFLRKNGRIMSIVGRLSHNALEKYKPELKRRLFNPNIQKSGLTDLMNEFVGSAKDGTFCEKGWTDSCYSASKIGVSILNIIWARETKNDHVISCMCPGLINTGMAQDDWRKSPDVGADTAIWFANLSHEEAMKECHGKYVAERKDIGYEGAGFKF